jgi:hypothetical protein
MESLETTRYSADSITERKGGIQNHFFFAVLKARQCMAILVADFVMRWIDVHLE